MARKRRAAKRPKGATKTPTAVKRSARAALSVATSGRRPVRKRVAAMAQAPLAVCESDKDLQAMLNVLRSEDGRLGALLTQEMLLRDRPLSPEMLRDLKTMMEERGFKEGNTTKPGDYVIERAFVEK